MSSRTWLRRSRAGTLAAGALLVLAACQDTQIVAPEAAPAETPASLSDPLAQAVANLGFRSDMIVDEGDYFVVEGDIVIPKRALVGPRSTPGGPSFQYTINTVVTQSKMAQGIRVNLSGIGASSAWLAAARSAITHWNNTPGTKIKLVEGTPADINVFFDSLPSGNVARGKYPVGGVPGDSLQVSSSASWVFLNQSQRTWVMVHEFGHTIGYRHSNWSAMGEGSQPLHTVLGANLVPGTSSSDANSVMNGGSVLSWNGFSTGDGVANRYVFPGPTPTLTSQGYNGSQQATFSWSAVADAAHYRITHFYDSYEWIYEPSFPEGGYWDWRRWETDLGTTTGTTYTNPYITYTGDGACNVTFTVYAVYASGKATEAAPTTFVYETC